MPVLIIRGVCRINLPTLGQVKALADLSEKRVTKAVRQVLRTRFGRHNVEVTCKAIQARRSIWTGLCKINGQRYCYIVQ